MNICSLDLEILAYELKIKDQDTCSWKVANCEQSAYWVLTNLDMVSWIIGIIIIIIINSSYLSS